MSFMFARGFFCFKTGTRKIFSPFQLFCLRFAGINVIGSSFRLKDSGGRLLTLLFTCIFIYTSIVTSQTVLIYCLLCFQVRLCCVQVRHMNLFMLCAIMRVKMRSLCIWTWLKVVYNCLFHLNMRENAYDFNLYCRNN